MNPTNDRSTARRRGNRLQIPATAVALAALALLLTGCGDEPSSSSAPSSTSTVSRSTPADDTGREIRTTQPAADSQRQAIERRVQEMLDERQRLDETVWAPEVEALRYDRALVELWDALNAADDKLATLAEQAAFNTLDAPAEPASTAEHARGITVTTYEADAGEPRHITPEAFREAIAAYAAAGHRLLMSDWHQTAFTPGTPPRSTVLARLYTLAPDNAIWTRIDATLDITWLPPTDPDATPRADTITVTRADVATRTGPPDFVRVAVINPSRDAGSSTRIEPLLVYDLNGDGLSEIILADANLILRNEGPGKFRREKMFSRRVEIQKAALIADLTGDGTADLVCASHAGHIWLFTGDATTGRWIEPPAVINAPETAVENMTAITAADIDGDGDLDLFAGQYKPPFRQGQMPTPYDDANDGFPAYLFRNNGDGSFTDITAESGLAPKRHRRIYAASLFDADADGDADLVTVSDFAGVDLFHNDGTGHFTDVTDAMVPDRHNFGMSHAIGDFNGDGIPDLYVLGMHSFTADRIEALGLNRGPDDPVAPMRATMAAGNRMYLGRADGGYDLAPFNDTVARTGWSWGVAQLDVENDGDTDLYVTNGHLTGASAADYCSTFWRHDLYTGTSDHDLAAFELFTRNLIQVNNRVTSWDGYQKKAMLLNESGGAFYDGAFPLGLAFEFDARAVAAADLDADGRTDLLVIEDRGPAGQVLHIMRNQTPSPGNWIGVRLAPAPRGFSPLGATVTIHTTDGPRTRWITSGDVFWAQNPPVAHFGLGRLGSVSAIEVRWPNGRTSRIEHPETNAYHAVLPPAD